MLGEQGDAETETWLVSSPSCGPLKAAWVAALIGSSSLPERVWASKRRHKFQVGPVMSDSA